MAINRDTTIFYLTLLSELALLPWLWARQEWKKKHASRARMSTIRKPVEQAQCLVHVHEWGGYPMVRSKTIKNGATFECGLAGQLDRFAGRDDVRLSVSISDAARYTALDEVRQRAKVFEVDNAGMDFSGYSAFFESVRNQPNAYIVLTNSSVNSRTEQNRTEHVLDGYIRYMEQHPEVGMLGVSYCTKMVQSLVRNNFTPHLQSFFLLTTVDVLRQVVALNGGRFPGHSIKHKLLLIRRGEIRLSQLVQKAGYELAVVNPLDGRPVKFTDRRHWKLPMGDIRQQLEHPNSMTPINAATD